MEGAQLPAVLDFGRLLFPVQIQSRGVRLEQDQLLDVQVDDAY
jgi:hypothetical protein